MSSIGVVAMLLGVLFTAEAGNELMRQLVIEKMTLPGLELAEAECPADEIEEEGLSVAECEQLVANVASYVVSRPSWFAAAMAWLAGIGTLLAVGSIVCGAGLVNYRVGAIRIGAAMFAALAVVDAGQFIVAQQAGPIVRAIHLPVSLLWFCLHLAVAIVWYATCRVASRRAADAEPVAYGRFEITSHWFIATAVFFLFVSSWWMLALPLPSDTFRYREFPFQLHKNLGITILLLLTAMALLRITLKRGRTVFPRATAPINRLRTGGHIALYVLLFAVCITGYLSSSYSGWGTTWWWVIDFPYWGHEDEELNQLWSDLHVWACLGLLVVLAGHIGAALLHAFRDDGIIRRIVRW